MAHNTKYLSEVHDLIVTFRSILENRGFSQPEGHDVDEIKGDEDDSVEDCERTLADIQCLFEALNDLDCNFHDRFSCR